MVEVNAALRAVDDVTADVFLGGAIRIAQPRRGYRAGLDAVMLGATVDTQLNGCVLDCGAGVGTVGLCVAACCPNAAIVLVEREQALLELAKINVSANGFDSRVTTVEFDVAAKTPDGALPSPLIAETFDVVLANPPYHDVGAGTRADDDLKDRSHAMTADQLEIWVRFMARMCRPGGQAIMVHKADALPRLLEAFAGRFGGIRVVPLYPRQGENAHRIIIAATKGSRAPLTIRAGLILHGDGNAFSAAADAILRIGARLTI